MLCKSRSFLLHIFALETNEIDANGKTKESDKEKGMNDVTHDFICFQNTSKVKPWQTNSSVVLIAVCLIIFFKKYACPIPISRSENNLQKICVHFAMAAAVFVTS